MTVSQLELDLSEHVAYRLVVSARARRASLRVEPGVGVVVTIPRRFARRDVPAFVESHRTWIEKTLSELERNIPERYRQWPPRELRLPAVGLQLHLHYARERPTDDHAHSSGQVHCLLEADPEDRLAVASELAGCLKKLASRYFPVRLSMLAEQHGLAYRRVQIRGQKSVWGSCSSTGTISLNYKLLFLDHRLVDYVFLHELAHTRYLDHSPAFWRQLESMLPAAAEFDARLRNQGSEVPPWLESAK